MLATMRTLPGMDHMRILLSVVGDYSKTWGQHCQSTSIPPFPRFKKEERRKGRKEGREGGREGGKKGKKERGKERREGRKERRKRKN